MSTDPQIRRMAAAGASPEVIALAVEEVEAIQASLDSLRHAARDRKRAQRQREKERAENQRNSANVTGHVTPMSRRSPPLINPQNTGNVTGHVTSPSPQYNRQETSRKSANVTGHVTDRSNTPLLPLDPPLESFPDPSKNTPPISPITPNQDTRARRLPQDWQPKPLTGQALEMVRDWRPGDIERELAKFRNYWFAKAGRDACKIDWQRTWINWLISADERKPRLVRGEPTGIGRTEAAARRALERP